MYPKLNVEVIKYFLNIISKKLLFISRRQALPYYIMANKLRLLSPEFCYKF
jgi:hypothetical protein